MEVCGPSSASPRMIQTPSLLSVMCHTEKLSFGEHPKEFLKSQKDFIIGWFQLPSDLKSINYDWESPEFRDIVKFQGIHFLLPIFISEIIHFRGGNHLSIELIETSQKVLRYMTEQICRTEFALYLFPGHAWICRLLPSDSQQASI